MAAEVLPERPVPGPLYAQPPSYPFTPSTHLKTGRPQLQKAVKKAWKDLSKKDKKNFKSTPLSQSSQKSRIFSTRWGGWLAWLKKPAQRKFFVTIKFLEFDDNRHESESYRFTTKQEHKTDRNKKKKKN